jgi:hypothetical protein
MSNRSTNFLLSLQSLPTHTKVLPRISTTFLNQTGLISDPKHPIRHLVITKCAITDGIYFLKSIHGNDFLDTPNVFREISSSGYYIHSHSRSELIKALAPVLKEHFTDDLCFLMGYYSWMIPIEIQAGYKESMEQTEKYIRDIERIKEDPCLNPYFILPEYYKSLKKSRKLEKIKKEMKTTSTDVNFTIYTAM